MFKYIYLPRVYKATKIKIVCIVKTINAMWNKYDTMMQVWMAEKKSAVFPKTPEFFKNILSPIFMFKNSFKKIATVFGKTADFFSNKSLKSFKKQRRKNNTFLPYG